MIKCFYIVEHLNGMQFVDPQNHAHYYDLPDGRKILSATFVRHDAQLKYEAQEGVHPLPHPMYEGHKAIDDEHADALAHLGVKRGHTVYHVAQILGALHPLMKLTSRSIV